MIQTHAYTVVDIISKHASGFTGVNGYVPRGKGRFENQGSGSFSRGRNSSSFRTPGIARLREETRDIPG